MIQALYRGLSALALAMVTLDASAFAVSSEEIWQTELRKVWQEAEMRSAGVKGWNIPVGPTGIRAIITSRNPTCFTVTYVFKNSPASGKIKPGDLIAGANGVRLKTAHQFGKKIQGGRGYVGPLTEMAPLIEESQGKDGKLALIIHPGGDTKRTETVTIKISAVGRFSKEYPYNCPRSDKLVTELCQIVEKELSITKNPRPHVGTHMILALMASGNRKYDSLIRKHASRCAGRKLDIMNSTMQSWGNGYEGVFLGEYYLRTKDKTVLSRIKDLNEYYADGIGYDRGCFSHKSRPHIVSRVADGGGYGYGALAVPAGLSMLGMSLFRAGDLPYAEFPYQRIHQAYLRTTTPECTGGGYGLPCVPSVHVQLENPREGRSGRGVGFRCPTGMKDITKYKITGVSYFHWERNETARHVKKQAEAMWADLSWVEKERDRNIVVEWAGNRRHIIRDPILPEPTRPYKTTRGNKQASAGLSALAHLIGNGDKKSWQYLGTHAANACALAHEQWCDGHASHGIHQLWVALGAARADKEKFRAFMDGVRWWFVLMQTHDGSYLTCPNRDRSQGDAGYCPYSMPTANAALILSLPRRALQITGAPSPETRSTNILTMIEGPDFRITHCKKEERLLQKGASYLQVIKGLRKVEEKGGEKGKEATEFFARLKKSILALHEEQMAASERAPVRALENLKQWAKQVKGLPPAKAVTERIEAIGAMNGSKKLAALYKAHTKLQEQIRKKGYSKSTRTRLERLRKDLSAFIAAEGMAEALVKEAKAHLAGL